MRSVVVTCGLVLLLLATVASASGDPCTAYDYSNQVCTDCTAFSYTKDSVCTACGVDHCENNECRNGNCTKCKDGFYLGDDKCKECLKHCKTCDNAKTCTMCFPTFKLSEYKDSCDRCNGECEDCSTGREKCMKCKDGTYPNDVTADKEKCGVDCPSYCAVCKTSGKCAECMKGYYLNGLVCTQCSGGCAKCTSDTACQECPANQYWDSALKTCTACDTQCSDCDLASKCKACKAGYFLDGQKCVAATNCKTHNDVDGCKECDDKYYKKAKGCTECPTLTKINCDKCEEPTKGRIYQDHLCQYCPDNCQHCNSTAYCISCRDDYLLNATTNECVACPTTNSSFTQTECDQCSTSYYDGGCYPCDSSPDEVSQAGCAACPGLYAATDSCVDCTVGLSSQSQCDSCAAAKVGYYYDSTCKQYNCSVDTNKKDGCEACGSTNVFVQCRACPTNSSHLTDEAECSQCKDFYWYNSECIDTTKVDCTRDFTNEDVCLFCGDHYYDNTTNTTKVCQGTIDEAGCAGCDGLYWDGTCKAIDCSLELDTKAKCNGCHYKDKYWNTTLGACQALDCTSISEEEVCDACQGKYWNSTACLDITDGFITDEQPARSLSGRYWNGSSCLAVLAGVGLDVPTDIQNGAKYHSPIPLYKNTTYEAATCDDFSTGQECTTCTGQYWDGSACKAVDCSGTLSNNNTCYACPGKYWDGSACATVADCSLTTLTAAQCQGCRWYGHYHDGTVCNTTTCSSAPATENECLACEGNLWNGTSCEAVSKGEVTSGEGQCTGLWARVWVDGKCQSISSKVGEAIDTDTVNNTYILIVERLVDNSDNMVYKRPTGTDADEYKVTEDWCKYGPANRYWATDNLLMTDCKDAKSLVCGNPKVRGAHSKLCQLCPGYKWDTKELVCEGVTCQTPDTITSKDDCAACGQGFVWEQDRHSGWKCRNLTATCSTAVLATEGRCTACSINPKARYLSTDDSCQKCSAYCKECNAVECIKCIKGYFWDGSACITCATTDNTKKEMQSRCESCAMHGTYLNGQKCANCKDANCMKCDANGDCETCKMSYLLQDGTCQLCSSDESSCKSCKGPGKSGANTRGTYWDTTCKACAEGCITCTSATACTECFKKRYYNDAGTCKACVTAANDKQCKACHGDQTYYDGGCKKCTPDCATCGSTGCTTCKANFYMDSTTKKCRKCSDSNCKICDSKTCTKCEDGFYVDVTDTVNNTAACIAKPANCITIKDYKGCTECEDTYIEENKLCTECKNATARPNCVTCEDTKRCKTCEANYALHPPTGECRECNVKIPNCDVCHFGEKREGGNFCDKCKADYCWEPQLGECIASTGLSCLTCKKTGTTVECIKCLPLKTKEMCKGCSTGCAKCTSSSACTECQSGYVLDKTTGSCTKCTPTYCKECKAGGADCTKCLPKYILQGNACVLCTANCLTCASNSTCAMCSPGHIKTQAAKCTPCIDARCDKCTAKCKGCDTTTHALDNGRCVTTTAPPSTTPAASASALQVTLVTVLVALLAACVGIL